MIALFLLILWMRLIFSILSILFIIGYVFSFYEGSVISLLLAVSQKIINKETSSEMAHIRGVGFIIRKKTLKLKI